MTARIALIAYLVGGWLMPAMHHHHGHGQAHHHHLATPCDHGHSHHAGHSHAHDQGSECDHGSKPEADHQGEQKCTQPGLIAAGSLFGCGGLCALCSARSLKTDRAQVSVMDCEPLQVTRHLKFDGIVHPLPMLAGAHLSRGPPSIV